MEGSHEQLITTERLLRSWARIQWMRRNSLNHWCWCPPLNIWIIYQNKFSLPSSTVRCVCSVDDKNSVSIVAVEVSVVAILEMARLLVVLPTTSTNSWINKMSYLLWWFFFFLLLMAFWLSCFGLNGWNDTYNLIDAPSSSSVPIVKWPKGALPSSPRNMPSICTVYRVLAFSPLTRECRISEGSVSTCTHGLLE